PDDRLCGGEGISRFPGAGPKRRHASGRSDRPSHGRARRSARHSPHGPELAGRQRSVVLCQSPAASDRSRPRTGSAAVRAGAGHGRATRVREAARSEIDPASGRLLPTMPAPRVVVPPLAERVAGLPVGTPYVLCLLKPSRDMTLDRDDLAAALRVLLGTSVPP